MSPASLDLAVAAAASVIVKASMLLGVAGLAQLILRRRLSAASRHFIWTLATLSILALPAVTAVAPPLTIELPGRQAAALPPTLERSLERSAAVADAAVLPAATLRSMPVSPTVRLPWQGAVLGLYTIGAIAILALVIAQHWRVRRLTRGATVLRDAEWIRLLAVSAEHLGIRRDVRLLRSQTQTMPFTFGLRRPSIVMPAASEAWTRDRRQVVLLHELAHIARHDCLLHTLACAAGAMYWFHPGVWWVVRRLRVERELACDDRVIEAGAPARDYAGHLLEIAYSAGRHGAPALAVSMARPRQLEGRMLAALNPAVRRSAPALRSRVAGAAIAAGMLAALAAVVPTSAAVVENVTVDVGATKAVSAPPLIMSAPATSHRASTAAPMAQDDLPGTWEIRPGGAEGTVNLRLMERNSSSSSNVPLAQLEGLTAAQLSGAGGPVQFRVRRDAGTFTFEGVVRSGVGGGTFTFAPDASFAGELAKRGLDRPTAREQYQLARHDIGYAFLDELNRQGYSKPATSDLVRAGQHGVSTTYLREMGSLGYKLGSLQPLIELRDHGVTSDYVRALAELGYKGLSHEEVRQARDHGVTAEYVRAMRDAGYGSLPLADLVNARDHGITDDYVRGLGDAGYRKLPLDQLVTVRDHGVTVEYVRDLRQLGYQLAIDDFVRARDHGVTVEYVRGMSALGYGKQPMDALIRVRDHDVTAEYAREVQSVGYTGVSLDDLVSLRDHGLTVDRIRAANTRAGTRLPIDMLKSLAAGGMR
jgi:beta-lactamase regulating signal transducer with metallopeptidase domain